MRKTVLWNDDWRFSKEGVFEAVTLLHTWNAKDGSSGILANFASKFGGSLGVFLTGILLNVAGYVSTEGVTAQPASAIFMIRAVYALVPALLLVLVAFCARQFMKLEPQAEAFNAKRKAELEAAQAEAAQPENA